MDADNIVLTTGWFAVFAVIIYLLCGRVLRMVMEDQDAARGWNDGGDNTVRQLQRNEASEGWVDRAPSSTVAVSAAMEMVPLVQTAKPQLVRTYRKTDGSPEGSCGVCLAEVGDGDAIRVLPACMHYFHAACVGDWQRKHTSCPLCGAPLVAPTSAGGHGEVAFG